MSTTEVPKDDISTEYRETRDSYEVSYYSIGFIIFTSMSSIYFTLNGEPTISLMALSGCILEFIAVFREDLQNTEEQKKKLENKIEVRDWEDDSEVEVEIPEFENADTDRVQTEPAEPQTIIWDSVKEGDKA